MQPQHAVFVLLAVTATLVVVLLLRPSLTVSRGGKILAFMALFILPVLSGTMGTQVHLEQSKSTEFCLSCHIMHPYGASLLVEDASAIPAVHYQKRLVPRDSACFTCHTDYAMFGGMRSKVRGLRHVWAHYIGTPQQPVQLYEPYNNRECLYCHLGARSFEENAVHSADEEVFAEIKSNGMSCTTGGCHDVVHRAGELKDAEFWIEPVKEFPRMKPEGTP